MFKQFGKVALSTIVASSVMLGASISAFASNAAPNIAPPQSTFSAIQPESDSAIHPDGVKKWITVQAMKLTAKGLRSGGRIVDRIAEELGGKEARYFTQHTDTVADALDDLIHRGDVVEDAIIDTVSTALISAGVPNGSARTIAAVFTFFAF